MNLNPTPISTADLTAAFASVDWSSVCNDLSAFGTVAAVFVAIYIYLADKRPDVVGFLDVDTDMGNLSFAVANYGNSAARNVRIKGFDTSLCMPEFRDKIAQTFVFRSIPCLVPNGIRRTSIATSDWAAKHLSDKECKITVIYERKGLFGSIRTNKETFVLDYLSFANSLYTKSETHLMRLALESIAKKL